MRMPMLAVAAALLVPSTAATQAPVPPVLTIALYSHGYAPNPIRLRAGQSVTLNFVNRAGKGHDFTAPRFFGSARLMAGPPQGGVVDLAPGASARVTLVPARGTYKVHCSHFFHKQLGMRGTIIVE